MDDVYNWRQSVSFDFDVIVKSIICERRIFQFLIDTACVLIYSF